MKSEKPFSWLQPVKGQKRSAQQRENPLTSLYRSTGFKGRVYPTGEFSFGWDNANYSLERGKSRNYERLASMQYHDVKDEDGVAWMRIPLDVAQVVYPRATEGQEERLNMGLSIPRNSPNRPARYGLKGLTSYGARTLKSAAYLLEEEYGKERLVFGTYTLPPMSSPFRKWFHENWNIFVKMIFKYITRHLEKQNAETTHYCHCTEVQEKRFRATGEVYLHLHFIFVGVSPEGRNYLSTRASDGILSLAFETMERLYRQATDDREPVWKGAGGIGASGRLERIRKSVVGYLGKYLSKGRALSNKVGLGERTEYYPRQWWGCHRGLLRKVKERIRTLPHILCDAIAHDASMQSNWVAWMHPITHEYQGTVYTLGYVGRLEKGWESLLDAFEPEPPTCSEPEGTLDPAIRIKIRRRRKPLENYAFCPQPYRRRLDSQKIAEVIGRAGTKDLAKAVMPHEKQESAFLPSPLHKQLCLKLHSGVPEGTDE